MKTWLLCEAAVHTELSSDTPRLGLAKECSDCANACFDLVARLVAKTGDIPSLLMNCLLHCRLCSSECEKYAMEEDIQFCGMVSNMCAENIKDMAEDMAVFQLN